MRKIACLLSSIFFGVLLPSSVRSEPSLSEDLSAIAPKIEDDRWSIAPLPVTNWNLEPQSEINYFDVQLSDEHISENELISDLETEQSNAQTMEQITNVNELRDVQPTEWAYEALRSLVERYGCIVGYPDGTYRGESASHTLRERALNRWEFAAGLNACMNTMERLMQENVAVLKEDVETLKRLAQEFAAELAALGGRVDNLEGRVAFLEDHQFSTTVTMNGEVIFGLATAFGGDPPGGCLVLPDDTGFFFGAVDATGDVNLNNEVDCTDRSEPDRNTVLAYLARIGLQASFTGKDRLRMFLTTGNFDDGGFTQPESLNTYMARLGYQAGLNNDVFLDILEYRFPLFDDKVVISAIPFGFNLSSVLSANSPYFDVGRGALSRFGQLNPLLRIGGPMDAGVGVDWLIAEPVRLQVAYGTRNSSDPTGGFVGADHSALGVQVLLQPFETLVAGITYVNSYSSDGSLGTFTGSVNAETGGLWSGSSIPDSLLGNPNNPQIGASSGFGACCGNFIGDFPAQINAVGGSLQWRVTENITFGAWGGYIFTDFLESLPNDPALGASAGQKPFANAATFAVSLGLSDPFGREGDLLGFIFGMPPKLVDAGPETQGTPVPFFEQVVRDEDPTTVTDNNPNLNTVGERNLSTLPKRVGQEDEATSLHFELFYRFKITDNIFITPGFFIVTNPGHIESNDTLFVGTIRTTFRF